MILSKVTEYVLLFHTSIAFTLYNFEENGKKKKKDFCMFSATCIKKCYKTYFLIFISTLLLLISQREPISLSILIW